MALREYTLEGPVEPAESDDGRSVGPIKTGSQF